MRRSGILAILMVVGLVAPFISESEAIPRLRRATKKCPRHDSIHGTTMLPHEWDCTKFYTCSHGRPILSECPVMDAQGNRLHFNPKLQVCDWPSNAKCVQGTKPTSATWPAWTSTTTELSKPSTDRDEWTSTLPTPSGINIPHEYNCSLYYRVIDGKRYLRQCPPDLHFSPSQLICMKPEDAGCESTTTTPECGLPCDDIPDGWLIPHECSCDKFYRCRNGDLIRHRCSNGLHFNAKRYTCDYPEAAGCAATTETPTTSEPETSPTTEAPATEAPATEAPATEAPATEAPATEAPATEAPATEAPATEAPATEAPATEAPATEAPATEAPATEAPATETPATEAPATEAPATEAPATEAPATEAPATEAPATEAPATEAPATEAPATEAPATEAPATEAPATEAPATEASATEAPATEAPATEAPATEAPATEAPATETPATEAPATEAPATEAPATEVPATEAPATEASTDESIISTPAGEPSDECMVDDSGSPVLLPHPYDCTLYYQCEDGRKVLKSCPAGLEFSPDLNKCDWPEVSGCVAGTTTGKETATPTTESETEATPKPTTESKVEVTAQPTTESEAEATPKPTTESRAEATTESEAEVTVQPTTESEAEATPKPTTESKTEVTAQPTTESEAEVTVQPTTESEAEATPRPTTESRTEVTAQPTTETETEATPKPTTESEVEVTAQPTTESEAEPTPQPTTESETEGTSPATEKITVTTIGTTEIVIPIECPPDNSGQTVHIAHPTNCSLFYQCDNGEKILQACPPDLEFNPRKQVCDWPNEAGCVASTTELPMSTTSMMPVEGTTSGPETSSEERETSSEGSKTSSEEPEPSSEGSKTSSEEPEPSSEGSKTSSEEPETSSETPEIPSEGSGTSNEGSKNSSEEPQPSSEGSKASSEEPEPSSEGSKASSEEREPSSEEPETPVPSVTSGQPSSSVPAAPTTVSSIVCPADQEGRLIPHENNCSLYYQCVNGNKVLMECPSGLHFSSDLEMCVWPENAGCEAVTPAPVSSTVTIQTTQEVTASPSTTEDISVEDNGACIGMCPDVDPEDYTVLLSHEDCTKFCKCSNSQAYVYDCPAGLHFSPTQLVCDYPENAQCEAGNDQDVTEERTVREY